MNGSTPPDQALADLCRQAGALARRVSESRWPGFTMPDRPAEPTAVAPGVMPLDKGFAVGSLSGTVGDLPGRPPASRTPDSTGHSLEEIALAVGVCTRCRLHEKRRRAVPGEGNPHAALVFVGEAPGEDEDLQGRPFVGRAGQLLDRMIAAMGLRRAEVFIANVVKCRPPGNRNPLPDEIAACRPFLCAQLDSIDPQVLCALGKISAQTLLETREPISRLRGTFREHRGLPLMPTFHPSYLLRDESNRKNRDLVWKDLQQILVLLGRPIPGANGRGPQP